MTSEKFAQLALSFPETEESAHFDRRAFKVIKRRIFATLQESTITANLRLSLVNQSVYCLVHPGSIYPVANKWGLQGWTTFEFQNIEPSVMLDALASAHEDALSKKKA